MCHSSCIIFGAINLTKDEVINKKIIEVGSYDMNGSLRGLYESWTPSLYTGVDIELGPGVDVVCNAEDIIKIFDDNSFDIVVSTELLEHVKDWRKVIANFKNICKPNGIILITTRSNGYPFHGAPYDFWRYEIEDIRNIFKDCIILNTEIDKQAPGVFAKIRKPVDFSENDLSNYELYSIIAKQRIVNLSDEEYNDFLKKYHKKKALKNNIKKIINKFKPILNKFIGYA